MPLPCIADLVLVGAHVSTMDLAHPTAEALAVRDGVLVAVGTEAQVKPCLGPDTRVEDLGGATVLPGFIDAHAHPAEGGLDTLLVELGGTQSLDEVLARARAWGDAHPEQAWIQGGGWDQARVGSVQPLSALDAAFGERPVILYSLDWHSAWVNSAALRIAGLVDAPDPRGGVIVRDAAGHPTGVLRETAADLVSEHLPAPTRAMIDEGITRALQQLGRYGITSVIEAASDRALLAGWRRAERAGRLSARIFAALPADPGDGPRAVRRVARLARRYHSERLRVNAVKVFLDGVIESQTALMIDPYTDGSQGPEQFTADELDTLFSAADRAGLQLHAHAIGDGAVRQYLDAIERLGPRDRRPLAAHIETIDPADIPRFASLGVYADIQALWAFPDPYLTTLTLPVLGPERTARAYPFGELQAAGATLVAGSDWDVTTLNPWPAIEVALTRQDPDHPGEVLGTGQNLTLQAMLHAYTVEGAKAVFAEERLGKLAVGYRADFVVLDRDPATVPTRELSEIAVRSTWVDGERVYTSPAL